MFGKMFLAVGVSTLALCSSLGNAQGTPIDGKIAYTEGLNIHVYDANSGKDTIVPGVPLTGSVGRPQWSSDGQWLTFQGTNAVSAQVYVVQPDGTGFRRVTDGTGDVGGPGFSPFADKKITYFQSYGSIYTINFDGTNRVQLPVSGSPPRWSPDGTKIAYTNWAIGTYESDVFVYDLVSGTTNQITNHVAGRQFNDLGWSPDSTKLVLAGGPTGGNHDIWTVNANGTNQEPTNLTSDWGTSHETSPSWSPDGKYIVFLSNRPGNQDIYGMLGDGTGRFNITNTPSINEGSPAIGHHTPTVTYDVHNGAMILDTHWSSLNGFIIHQDRGDFTEAAVLPPGFIFNDNSANMIAAQFPWPGNPPLVGIHDFGDHLAYQDAAHLWDAVGKRWDLDNWRFTYTVDGLEGVFSGDINLVSYWPGDTDLDGDVDAWDIQRILAANSYMNGSGWSWADGDFSLDGLVNWDDIQMILDHGRYEGDIGPQQIEALFGVPEPATLTLLALGGLALVRRRRK